MELGFVPSNKHSEKDAVNCVKHTGVNKNQTILFLIKNQKAQESPWQGHSCLLALFRF